MGIPEAFVYYIIRLVMFSVVAGIGIKLGIVFRKRKDAQNEVSSDGEH